MKNGVQIASYIYDESGLRLKKTGINATVYYVFDTGGNVLYEQGNREYLEYIYVLGKHFARVDGNLDNLGDRTKYFYHTDHLGSTVAVTDDAGQTVWASEYTPFGGKHSVTGELGKAAKFTGKDLDEDVGLYYFNARWLDQETGRFISEDPAADPNNPNLYVYSRNNPLRFTDPSGLISQEDAMELHELNLKYDYPDYIKDLIFNNIEIYGYENALEFGLGIYAIQVLNNSNLTKNKGFSTVAIPEVRMLEERTGVKYNSWYYNVLEINYRAYAHFGTNVAALDFQMNTQRVNQALDVMGVAYAMGIISKLGVLPNNPEVEFKRFNLGEGTSKTISDGICFTGDTLIATKDGFKQIKDIEVGDEVYSENPETGEKGLKKVRNVFINKTKEIIHLFIGQEEIKATPTHPFWVEGKGWITAGELQARDKVRLYNGNIINVDKTIAEKFEESIKVYNFEVEDWHTYFVSSLQVLVHNTCEMNVYRGGNSFNVRPGVDIKIDKSTGLLKTERGVSVNADPSKVENFGGAYKVGNIPEGLKIVQVGKPGHYEIVPTAPITLEQYINLLNQIKLTSIK